ncbi:MAG: TRAP transporter substrate-binding protein [Pseudomonadota bacterium]|nr:TRAP transporter substrate-binding protein [Pseudomonadota bacterium]
MSSEKTKMETSGGRTSRRDVLAGGLAAAGGLTATSLAAPMVARAQETFSWRIQTHYSSGSPAGQTFQRFIDNVATMSDGRLKMEGYTDSSLVKITETLNATRSGILDADMSWPGYAVGIDPAFQFLGDLNGGYDIPEQPQYWLDHFGGRELADELFHAYNMQLIGFWGTIPESLVSTKPIPDYDSMKGFRLRCPPGLQSDVFRAVGAEPVVMDFGEVFSALDTGIVNGADAAELRVNQSLGLYEVAKHATYPGFHAMPWVHLAVNKDRWDALPADLQRIVEIALKKAAYERAIEDRVLNDQVVLELEAEGVTVYSWSDEDVAKFRQQARQVWEEWAQKSPLTQKIYASHEALMKQLGILPE